MAWQLDSSEKHTCPFQTSAYGTLKLYSTTLGHIYGKTSLWRHQRMAAKLPHLGSTEFWVILNSVVRMYTFLCQSEMLIYMAKVYMYKLYDILNIPIHMVLFKDWIQFMYPAALCRRIWRKHRMFAHIIQCGEYRVQLNSNYSLQLNVDTTDI